MPTLGVLRFPDDPRCRRQLRPDIVLLGVKGHEPDGFEVCRRLIAEFAAATVRIVLFSNLPEAPSQASGLGALRCLRKPNDFPRIGEVLRRLVTSAKRCENDHMLGSD